MPHGPLESQILPDKGAQLIVPIKSDDWENLYMGSARSGAVKSFRSSANLRKKHRILWIFLGPIPMRSRPSNLLATILKSLSEHVFTNHHNHYGQRAGTIVVRKASKEKPTDISVFCARSNELRDSWIIYAKVYFQPTKNTVASHFGRRIPSNLSMKRSKFWHWACSHFSQYQSFCSFRMLLFISQKMFRSHCAQFWRGSLIFLHDWAPSLISSSQLTSEIVKAIDVLHFHLPNFLWFRSYYFYLANI
jgi:hypothetical protein